MRQSLENYLLTLEASDDHDTAVLRVFALWFEYADMALANNAVGKHLMKVPSHKFAILMNQLSSRLQHEQTEFQTHLAQLITRICIDHPYHGMHQIYAGHRPTPVKEDSAKSRNEAAKAIVKSLKADKRASRYWNIISESNTLYHELAMVKEDTLKPGSKFQIDKLSTSRKMMQRVPVLKVPPPTLSVDLRPDCDYRKVPVITNFRSKIEIASGLSAPKVVSMIASDGRHYKLLVSPELRNQDRVILIPFSVEVWQ